MTRHPPERIDLGDLVLRRERVGDEDMLAAVLVANLDHLRPWMRWAKPENATAEAQRARLVKVEQASDQANDHVEIHCDEANGRSAKVPQRLGYRLHRTEPDEIEATGEVGRSMVWVYPPNVSQAAGSPDR